MPGYNVHVCTQYKPVFCTMYAQVQYMYPVECGNQFNVYVPDTILWVPIAVLKICDNFAGGYR